MSIYRFVIFLFFIFGTFLSRAQSGDDYLQPRILILLDKSSSMINKWDGGKQKSKAADEIILRLIDSIYAVNKNVEFSLRVFGAQYTVAENNCRDTKNEVPFRKDNRLQMEYRLDDLQPLGVTSIAYALLQAAENDLVDIVHNAYSIILITDGGESCGGDICEVMRMLKESKVFFRPYIVSLEHSVTLKASYDCMGDYLEVTKQNDIAGAVSRIVTAFRPMISLTSLEYNKVKEIAAAAPKVMGVTIPNVKVSDTTKSVIVTRKGNTKIGALLPSKSSNFLILRPDRYQPKVVNIPESSVPESEVNPIPKYDLSPLSTTFNLTARRIPIAQQTKDYIGVPRFEPKETEELPAPVTITPLHLASKQLVAVSSPAQKALSTRKVAPYQPVSIFEKPEPEQITKLALTGPHRFWSILVMEYEGRPLRAVKLPAMPKPKFEPGLEASATAPTTENEEIRVDREEAKETTVQVYFTNGKGKFYETTPQVMLLDPKTKKMVKRFYRMVDGNGQPDPQKNIPPGKYTLTFADMPTLVYDNLLVEKDKNNKIYITVKPASLVFEYVGSSRPVSEFAAEVIERNKANGRVEIQKCTDRLEYEPGNYHVRINTFPQDVRNLDLDFGEKVIRILQPGFASFVGDGTIKTVKLYQQLGDKFRQFTSISIDDPKATHLRLQPGEYQAHYNKGPGGPAASEKVVVFRVKATEETKVILK